jgi:hypothetical protein
MSLVIIFGPPAVGKATVGRVLAEQTGYKLLHNHMTVDLVGGIFDFGTDAFRALVVEFRQRVVEETARAGVGLILTMAWSLDDDDDAALVADYDEAAAAFGRAVYLVELAAPFALRKERNRLPDRLANKRLVPNDDVFAEINAQHRLNSTPGEFSTRDHVLIDTEAVSPEQAAARIVESFGLP